MDNRDSINGVMEHIDEHGFDVNGELGNRGRSILHVAVKSGHQPNVGKILNVPGVDVNSKDEDGKTPLHLAIYAGYKEIVDMLLGVSVTDVNLKDNEGAYPLHWAAKLGYATTVGKILKEKNGDVNCTDNTGMTPLHWVAKNTEWNSSDLSDHVAVVEIILAAPNVDASKRDNNGISPLRMATMRDQYVLAEMILKALGEDFMNICERNEEFPLHWAAIEGKRWVVEMILKISGVDVNCEDNSLMTPLHLAAMEGQSEVVDVLLGAKGTLMNYNDSSGMTPLHWAVMEGHHAVVKTLCSQIPTVDVNSKDEDGKTPLQLAVENGHEAIVEEILEHLGVDSEKLLALDQAIKLNHKAIVQIFLNKLGKNYFMQERFSNGETPMHMAAATYGHEQMVKMLQDSDVLKDANGMTPLHCAAEGGHTSLVERLLKIHTVDVNYEDTSGKTPLHLAVSSGDDATVLKIIGAEGKSKAEAKARDVNYKYDDLNSQDENGNTPLHLAIYNGHKEIADMLLSFSDIDVNLKDNEGTYPLHLAAKLGYATTVEKILKEKYGDVNCTDNTGMTPLHWVAKYSESNSTSDLSDHAAVVKRILAAPNVDASKRDNNGISPFMMAMMHHKYVIAVMILKALGNDVLNICEHDGESLLHWAATVGKIWVVKMILKIPGVDVNLKDIYQMTPLHRAAKEGHRVVVAMFLKRSNVSLNCKDISGWTPLHWAASNGHHTIVRTLCSKITNDIVNDIDKEGKTALYLAVEEGHEEVVKEIMKVQDIDLVNEDFYKLCPLCRAIWRNNEAIVQMFLEALGKNYFVNKRLENGKTLMHLAAKRGHAAMVEKLSEAGLDTSVTDAKKRTPLHCASKRGHAAAVKTLLEVLTPDVNCKDTKERAPLHFAVLSGDKETVLHITGAKEVNVNCVDKHGKTPLHWAVHEKTPEILFILLKNEDTRLVEDKYDKTALEYAFGLSQEPPINRTIVGYLSESPIGKAFVDACFRDRQVYVDASNAILVGAALIAGVTFASWLQPPLGYSTYYEETLTNPYPGPPTSYPNYVDFEHHKALQAFWIFNSLSFFFSTSTMVMGARSVLPMQNVFLKQAVRKIRLNLLITTSLLVFSILFGMISFAIAGYIVIPPKIKFQANILSTIAVGGLICLSSLYFLGRSLAGELKPLIMKFIVGDLKP
jgi:ankyrin repeat protein